jgi:hypothetical protein
VTVASAATDWKCGRDGDTVSFRLQRGTARLGLHPTATFRPGEERQLHLSGRDPFVDVTATAAVAICPTLAAVTLTATPESPGSDRVTLGWQVTGGCGWISGAVTARYNDQTSPPHAQYTFTAAGGTGTDRPRVRCGGPYSVEYTVEVTDGRGGRATARATATVSFRCAG